MFLRQSIYDLGIFHVNQTAKCLRNQGTKAELRMRVGGPQTDKVVEAPPPSCNFIAGRPKAALLFWVFGDFKCDMPLLIVILVTYKNSNR